MIAPYPGHQVHGVEVCYGLLRCCPHPHPALCPSWVWQVERPAGDWRAGPQGGGGVYCPSSSRFWATCSVLPGPPSSRHWGLFPPFAHPDPGLPTAPRSYRLQYHLGSPYVCSHFGTKPLRKPPESSKVRSSHLLMSCQDPDRCAQN